MGSFDHPNDRAIRLRAGRTVLKSSIGASATNDPEDIHRIEVALRAVGLIEKDAHADHGMNGARETVQRAIRLAGTQKAGLLHQKIEPGSMAEIVLRRALAQSRLPRAHKAIVESASPVGARSLIGGGMQRARAKLGATGTIDADDTARFRRAVLPAPSTSAMQSNIRLAASLMHEAPHPAIASAVAAALSDSGRQGFADVRDLWARLKSVPDARQKEIATLVDAHLNDSARIRFKKLLRGEVPTEGDFADVCEEPAS